MQHRSPYILGSLALARTMRLSSLTRAVVAGMAAQAHAARAQAQQDDPTRPLPYPEAQAAQAGAGPSGQG